MSEQILIQILEKLDSLDDRMNRLEAKHDSQSEHIHQLIHIVGSTNSRLEELTEDVSTLKEDVMIVKQDVSILKANQQTVIQIQQEQQRILERLSFRSIEHEADIAELRRIK